MYDVGQILYVVSKETQRIIPLFICEEIRRRTSAGEEISYLVRGGAEMTTFDLKTITGSLHKSVDDALNELRNNFEQFLQQQVAWTSQMQRIWYQPQVQIPASDIVQHQQLVHQDHIAPKLNVPSYEELVVEANKQRGSK